MPVIKLIMEGLGLGFLLYLICAIGIRNSAITPLISLYSVIYLLTMKPPETILNSIHNR